MAGKKFGQIVPSLKYRRGKKREIKKKQKKRRKKYRRKRKTRRREYNEKLILGAWGVALALALAPG